jgi:hypothetical protein
MATSNNCGVVEMVNHVGIYGFCLFKQKRWIRADVSINTNMYGLKLAAGKEISEEEGNNRLASSSAIVRQRKAVCASS